MVYTRKVRGKLSDSWKMKVYDNEVVEPPHVHILNGPRSWRYNLRTSQLMDGKTWAGIPRAIRKVLEEDQLLLVAAWDRIHPDNPVEGQSDA